MKLYLAYFCEFLRAMCIADRLCQVQDEQLLLNAEIPILKLLFCNNHHRCSCPLVVLAIALLYSIETTHRLTEEFG